MRTVQIFMVLLFLSHWCLGQEETAYKQKVTTFSIFDTKIEIIEEEDGKKSWEFTPQSKAYYEDSKKHRSTYHSSELGFDLGINTWVQHEEAPKVRPWGSWNPAINLRYSYQKHKNFELNTLLGVSWYNFKFEDANTQALRSPEGIVFEEFDGNAIKSKISASYLNLSLIPTIHSNNGKFRIGIGPYAGYRLGGRGKLVYRNENGNRNKAFQRANMYANNIRYGGRLEIGVGGVDLFLNYDFNEYFQQDKGPRVNAISFGLIL